MELTEKNIKNFWEKVDIKGEDECWEWTASKDRYRYGQIKIDKKTYKSHRISWVLANGDIPFHNSYHGICVCHKCDNPSCCNPHHLFLGTNKDNIDDKVNKYRQVYGEKNGRHKLTEKEILEIRQKYSTGLYLQIRCQESLRL